MNIRDKKNNIFAEIDITLDDGDKVMIVEVKNKPTTGDVIEHIKRLEKVKTHARLRGDKRTFLGAFGGVVIANNVKAFALKKGFYVVEPSGETFDIVVPEGVNAPREW